MKKHILTLLVFTFVCNVLQAQTFSGRSPFIKVRNRSVESVTLSSFTVDSITPADLVANLAGPGAIISNVTFTGSPSALGLFSDSAFSIGMDSGVVISTGLIESIPGPNVSGSTGISFVLPGDSMLSVLSQSPTFDAAIIEFDMQVFTDTLACDFVFGSEEYPEYVNQFNDVFAFLVSGPGLPGVVNIAVLPGTNTVICINNINDQLNSQYYVDNLGGAAIEFDGYTVPLCLKQSVIYGETYHFKIAIADASDGVFDSGIFLRKGSILGYATLPVPGFTPEVDGAQVQFTNTTNYARYYTWDYGDGRIDTTVFRNTNHKYAEPGQYTVTLKAYNFYQVAECSQVLSIGSTSGISSIAPEKHNIKVQNLQGGNFRLDLGSNANADIQVYAITGELKYSCNNNGNQTVTLKLENLAKGLYILRVNTQDQSGTWKIVR